MNMNLDSIQTRLGYRFRRPDLLKSALTHPSYAAEQRHPDAHNQRLEFLGDSVLQMVVTVELFRHLPEEPEGVLTKLRSALTKEPALARFAAELDLGTCLLLGKGEELTGGRERPSNLADAFEAVLGALYLDGGWDAAEILCRPFVQECLREPERVLRAENPKGALQELTLSRFQSTPDYVTVTVSGPVHAPSYEVKVLINGQCFGQALAGSRKAAEKAAAREALAKLLTDAGDEPPHDEKLAEQEG